MPAGSGSRPSSASSGAVESECQHEAEADDFDVYVDEDGTDDINDIDDIDDIFKPWYGPPCVLLLLVLLLSLLLFFVRTYACMLLLMMVALMFSHPCWPQPHETRVETDETMKLLLASAP